MALRKIRTEGDEILRKKSREVTAFDDRLHTLIDDMYETMVAAPGLGQQQFRSECSGVLQLLR